MSDYDKIERAMGEEIISVNDDDIQVFEETRKDVKCDSRVKVGTDER